MRLFFMVMALCGFSTGAAFAQIPMAPVFRALAADPSMGEVSSSMPEVAPAPALPMSRRGEVIDSVGGDAIPSLPIEALQENGISYLSGGIGDEEVAQLKAQEAGYNLRLQITGITGEYLSSVSFTLKDAQENILLTIADAGPYVYLQLPAGNYLVEAVSTEGNGKKLPVKLPAHAVVKGQIRL